jgi:hypothetical protein
MKTPYLEEFLKKMCTRKVALDLLWKYYVSENNYAAATLVLMQQAELPYGFSLFVVLLVIFPVD